MGLQFLGWEDACIASGLFTNITAWKALTLLGRDQILCFLTVAPLRGRPIFGHRLKHAKELHVPNLVIHARKDEHLRGGSVRQGRQTPHPGTWQGMGSVGKKITQPMKGRAVLCSFL